MERVHLRSDKDCMADILCTTVSLTLALPIELPSVSRQAQEPKPLEQLSFVARTGNAVASTSNWLPGVIRPLNNCGRSEYEENLLQKGGASRHLVPVIYNLRFSRLTCAVIMSSSWIWCSVVTLTSSMQCWITSW